MSLSAGLHSLKCQLILSKMSVRMSTSIIVKKTPGFKPKEFQPLSIRKKKVEFPTRKATTRMVLPPRCNLQKTDQDWGSVWPSARSFHPATVPFPIRQGYPNTGSPTPSKWGNSELMKIPNFLHLTPPVIRSHCEKLKAFCTRWPYDLSKRDQETHFPVTVKKSTYLHASPSIRDPKSRVVTYQVSLSALDLDDHSRDKLLRLVGDRYDPHTNYLTIVADRCPTSKQNHEYCRYLLTVLYTESKKIAPWEHEKERADQEHYVWKGSSSEAVIKTVFKSKLSESVLNEYKEAITELHNEGEDVTTLSRYGKAVLKVIGLA